jgi:transmembrane sensor
MLQSQSAMDRIKYLILRSLREESSPAEQVELERWRAEAPANQALWEELQDPAMVAETLAKLDQLHRQEAWTRVDAYAATHRPMRPNAGRGGQESGALRRVGWRKYAVAAVLIALLGTCAWWIVQRRMAESQLARTGKPRDVSAPATNRATITLAGGQQVFLDSAGNGALARQGSAQLVKLGSGQVAYQASVTPLSHGEMLYNTLSNPRGSQVVSLMLSDGTRVWLNAASSIRYPVVFNGQDRTVEISGEGYLEVAPNAGKPFKVQQGRTMIEVLGTAFNVNAYADELALKVTLLSGKVRVYNNGNNVLLQPGQQAVVAGSAAGGGGAGSVTGGSAAGSVRQVGFVDTAAVMAWKNGLFAFHNADLPMVMRQLARWYNIDVSYEGIIPQEKYQFNGKMGKDLSLNNVLDLLSHAQVHYSIEAGNKLVIRP